MKRVLVTGASGFIGRHALAGLKRRGFEIQAVASKPHSEKPPSAAGSGPRWLVADLLDARRAEALLREFKPTHLLHFAWDVPHGAYWESTSNFDWVRASLDLLRTFREQGGRRAVLAGTCAEYDWSHGRCSEASTPREPGTTYGRCKHALQLLAHAYAEQSGLSAAWGRIFFPYGPYERPERLIPSVIRSLLVGREAAVSHGSQVRDLMYVQDVADAFVALLDSEAQGAINVASGQPVTLKSVLERIADRLQGRHLVRFGAVPQAPNDVPLLVADVRRLNEEVGFAPGTSLEQGLEHTIEWWRSRSPEPA